MILQVGVIKLISHFYQTDTGRVNLGICFSEKWKRKINPLAAVIANGYNIQSLSQVSLVLKWDFADIVTSAGIGSKAQRFVYGQCGLKCVNIRWRYHPAAGAKNYQH